MDAVSDADWLKENYIRGIIDMRQNGRRNNGSPCDWDKARR